MPIIQIYASIFIKSFMVCECCFSQNLERSVESPCKKFFRCLKSSLRHFELFLGETLWQSPDTHPCYTQEDQLYLPNISLQILSWWIWMQKQPLNMEAVPPRLKLTLPWWRGFPWRSFYPSASTRRAQLTVEAKVVRPTDLFNNVRYWLTTD